MTNARLPPFAATNVSKQCPSDSVFAAVLGTLSEEWLPNVNLNWVKGTDPCTSVPTWTGVTCKSDGSVDSILLSGVGLIGTIPAAISLITSLTVRESFCLA